MVGEQFGGKALLYEETRNGAKIDGTRRKSPRCLPRQKGFFIGAEAKSLLLGHFGTFFLIM